MGCKLTATVSRVAPVAGKIPVKLALAGVIATPASFAVAGLAPITVGLAGDVEGPGSGAGKIPVKLGMTGAVVGPGPVAGKIPVKLGMTGAVVGPGPVAGKIPVKLGMTGAVVSGGGSGGGGGGMPPVITSLSPGFGPASGPNRVNVTLTGSGFTGATQVLFGATNPQTFTVISDTSITVTAASASSSGVVNVAVITPAGSSATTSNPTFSFT